MEMKPTLATIAAEIGLTKTSVSLALHNSPRISKKTRALVLEVADRLGYRPNPMVSALMATVRATQPRVRRDTLCFLTCFPERDEWKKSPTLVQLHHGILRRADALGCGVETHWHGEANGSGARLSQILEARGISGVIVAPFPSLDFEFDLRWDQFSTVAIGFTFNGFPAHRVSNNQFHTISLAMDEAARRGYVRPGLAMPKKDADEAENIWLAGYHFFQVTHPELAAAEPLLSDDFSKEMVADWMRKERPDVVITTRRIVHPWILGAAPQALNEVGFIHLNWEPSMDDFAGIDQNTGEVGAAATDLLVQQIYSNSRGVPKTPKTVLINGKWRGGATLRDRRQ
jgi:DNA-binding LacI/PurR family transcriptional regulator